MKLAVFTALTPLRMFQLLLKGCTIEAFLNGAPVRIDLFQLLLKGCTIEAPRTRSNPFPTKLFQLLLKGCTIEADTPWPRAEAEFVSVVVERMYD